MTKALMLAPGLGAAGDSPAADSTTADSPILDEVADLIAAAVARHEALGLAAPLTAADYRVHLDSLLKQAAAGDAGLGVVLSTAGDVLSTASVSLGTAGDVRSTAGVSLGTVGDVRSAAGVSLGTADDVRSAAGDVLGTAQWTRSSYRTRRVLAELDRVCVVPTARGLGVGRTLVDLLAADAAEHGIEVLGLEVRGNNHAAIALYERCGFHRTGRIPNAVAVDEERYDVVLMHRELGRPEGVSLIGSEPTGAGSSTLR